MGTAASGLVFPGLKRDESRTLARWRISTFWVLLLGYIGYYLCRANLAAAYPLLSRTFGYTNTQLGLIGMYSELAYAAGKFINGPIGDRIGGKKIFLAGMAGAILFNLIFAQGSSLLFFIIVWCLCRYCLSMGWGGIVKTVGAWYPPEQNGTIMGIISINFQLGGAIAAFFSGYLVALGLSWDKLFVYPALILSGMMVISSFAMKESPADVFPHLASARRPHSPLKHAVSDTRKKGASVLARLFSLRVFRHLLGFSFLTTFLRSMFFFWTAKFLVDIGMKDSSAIISSGLFPLLGCIGTFTLGWYTDRFVKNGDRARILFDMLICLALCLFAIASITHLGLAAPHPLWIVSLIGLSGFFLLGPYSMSAGCMTLDIAGAEAAATAAGWIDGIGYIGGSLAVWGTGLLADRLGWAQVFVILGFSALLSALSALLMSRAIRKR